VVLVPDVTHDLLCRAPIRGRERLVPAREKVCVGRGNGVRSDLRELALDLQAEAVEVEVIRVIVERVLAGKMACISDACGARRMRTTYISWPISRKPRRRKEANAVALCTSQ
jgi:hypothetical protein